jgi:hypothetical protein
VSYRVGIGRGEVPPENGAIGSTSVESWWVVKCGGGGDFVRWRCIWPYTRHGSALHGLFSSGVHTSESVTEFLWQWERHGRGSCLPFVWSWKAERCLGFELKGFFLVFNIPKRAHHYVEMHTVTV